MYKVELYMDNQIFNRIVALHIITKLWTRKTSLPFSLHMMQPRIDSFYTAKHI